LAETRVATHAALEAKVGDLNEDLIKELKLNKIKNGEFVGLANFYFI